MKLPGSVLDQAPSRVSSRGSRRGLQPSGTRHGRCCLAWAEHTHTALHLLRPGDPRTTQLRLAMRPLTSPCSGTAPQDGCRAGCPGRVGWAVCCQCSQTLSGGLLQPPVPHQKGALKPGPLLLAPRCLLPLQHPPAPPTGAAWFSPKPPRAAPAARRSCLLSGTTDSSPAFRPAGVTCADTSTLSPGRTSALSGSPTSCRCPEALRGG